uniref:Uncharacterized protein n=1 Tax=Romanomermis culicivorax TaxID=13658 RepID=A0A915IQ64_ROMCU
MDVEPTILKSAPIMPTTTSLQTRASRSVLLTTVTLTMAMTTLTAATTSTTPMELRLVIATHPVLGAIPPASIDLHFKLQLPSETITLPNYGRFCTTNSPHLITLATPRYPPRIHPNVSCIDAVQTVHFALFLYEARGLNNPSCLIQAYNTAISLIDSWTFTQRPAGISKLTDLAFDVLCNISETNDQALFNAEFLPKLILRMYLGPQWSRHMNTEEECETLYINVF